MKKQEFCQINKNSWNILSKSDSHFSNASLPWYGPFMEGENKLNLLKDVKDKNVLELGCGSGGSLKFLYEKGAKVWGIDISENQIKKAKRNVPNSNLFVSTMEENPGIPTNYFDYVLLLYSIGYGFNIIEILEKAYEYLKLNGKIIISWTHPFFNCLEVDGEKIVVNKSYYDEKEQIIIKGEEKVKVMQHNYKISTLLNSLIKTGFVIDKMIEENPISENYIGTYKSSFFDKKKLKISPTTLILIAHKSKI